MVAGLDTNLENVRRRMRQAAERAGRDPESITLVAVTKTVGVEIIRGLIALGVRDLGENRLQVAKPKIETIEEPVRWHMIGHLQRNKVRAALPDYSLFHGVDSPRLIDTFASESRRRGEPSEILLQVNVSGEESKGGFTPGEVLETYRQCRTLGVLRVRGLMTMAPFVADPEEARPVFRGLREVRDEIQSLEAADGNEVPDLALSMGMSNDFEVAIEEGADLVRVGSALFEGIEG